MSSLLLTSYDMSNIDFKIITFQVSRDPHEYYAKSEDVKYIIGHTLDFSAGSRQELHNSILLEINSIFFQEYDIDFFASEANQIEILLSKGVPIVGGHHVI